MRKIYLITILSLLVNFSFSQQKIRVHNSGNTMYVKEITSVDSIKLDNTYAKFKISDDTTVLNLQKSLIDSLTFTSNTVNQNKIYIIYNGTDNATIINPYATSGITITAEAGTVTVTATSGIDNLEYNILGSSANGSLTMTTDKDVSLVLNNLTLTNPSGAAFSVSGGKTTNILLTANTTNTLTDGSTSTKNGTITTNGPIVIQDSGVLIINGIKKHGINTSSTITIQGGTTTIASAATDGLHSEGFSMNNGILNVVSSVGDGVDAGDSPISISGGTINITSTANDVKAIKTGTNTIVISGGTFTLNVSGAQSKAISAKGNITINGGTFTITTSGIAVLTADGSGFDPSYCTAIKSDAQIAINNGYINIQATSTANGAKGISADGDITINGGTIIISAAGNGATYTDSTGVIDSYTATCIKSDTNISLLGGSITTTSSGTGGKGIKADGTIIIGNSGADNSVLTLNVTTTGNRFLVSGTGNNADYANPKAISCEGNLTLNSGTVTVNCTQSTDGGEGLESKATLTINGGLTDINTYDDGINAATAIIINGGETYCKARGNDGIDSNGTLTINGGFTVSNGARTPEEGFDCDNNTFKITGGTIVGTGGATSNPTTTVSTQRSYKITTTAGTHVGIRNSSGTMILMYKVPTYSGTGNQNTVTLLFTSPLITAGTYTILRGGAITGGTDNHGYNTGGTYSGGTSTSSTVSSYLTTVN